MHSPVLQNIFENDQLKNLTTRAQKFITFLQKLLNTFNNFLSHDLLFYMIKM